jgi:hypothetical protein
VPAYEKLDILHLLDGLAERFQFPVLDSDHLRFVSGRLHAFRDDERWALIIELLGDASEGPINVVYGYGNCLPGAGGRSAEAVLHPIAIEVDAEGHIDLERVEVRGQPVRFAPGAVHPGPRGYVTGLELLLALLPVARGHLFATETELRQLVPADLPRLLQLEEWCHPDVTNGDEPSSSPCFDALATAMVAGSASAYQPDAPPNTSYQHWAGR